MTRPPSNERTTGRNVGHRLDRRHFLITLVGVPALAAVLAACGDPDVAPGDTAPGTAPPTSVSGDTIGTTGMIEHPTGAEDVVLRVGYANGFVPQTVAFQHVPNLLVAGDLRVFQPAAQTAIYPGPLLPAITVATITEAGLQRLLGLAATGGLLTEPVPSYDVPMTVADAPDTVVDLHTAAGTFHHQAYALGITGGADENGTQPPEATPARQHLQAFVAATGDLATTVGAGTLGKQHVFAADRFRLRAIVTDPAGFDGADVKPTVSPWPADTGLRLADAADCLIASGPAITALLTAANVLSLFTEGGIAYQLAAAPVLPGDAC
ncbi:MAG: hypothetical protein ABIR68_16540 [Ilumatobacteraceae bacterium]